ncbi:ASCH domain-containing protein [Streptomyces sp. NPDC057592]|uniref:ASCH domain-containing protein n=1 Tax=unclassified Streptomyces TaxID=2593676 RepID=UPI0036CCEDDF
MRALTIRQPWAAAIIHGDKRVENRVWPSRYRGVVLLHAGKTLDRHISPLVAAAVRGLQLERGAVLGIARIADCHPDDGQCTPWSRTGHFHHVLTEVTSLPLPVPWPGSQGLWVPPTTLLDRVREQLDDATAARLLGEEAGPC